MVSAYSQIRLGLLFWLLLAICAWLYWPGLSGPQLLDDGVNLRTLNSLQENPDYLKDIVLGNGSGPLGRPVSMLSFGLQYLYADQTLWGFKYHNLMLHLLIGCVMAWLAHKILPLFAQKPIAAGWSVLVAAMWLLTPLFVSTTLYIVQRMTQLATLFCVLGLLVYIVGRLRLERQARGGWLSISAVVPCAALAVLSKENGAVLLPLIVLVESVIWRWRVEDSIFATQTLRAVHGMTLALGLTLVLSYVLSGESNLLAGYANRDFSLGERLLTQARVLWDYVYRLLLPMRHGLGIFHDDFVLSRGLLSPAGTLPAVMGVVLAVGVALWQASTSRSALAFAVLFFLGAHSVESTVIPLENYFEHRNYLPAFGLYLGAALLLQRFWCRFEWARPLLGAGIVVWLGVAAVNTGLQAAVWSKEFPLLMDAARNHPESLRVQSSLAMAFARIGAVDVALARAELAAQLDAPEHSRHRLRRITLLCLANAPLRNEFVDEFRSNLKPDDLSDQGLGENMQVLVEAFNRGQCPELDLAPLAAVFRERLLVSKDLRAAPKVYGLLAMMEIYIGDHITADRYLELWLQREPDSVQAWMMRLSVAAALGDEARHEDAMAHLQRLLAAGLVTQEQEDDIVLFDSSVRSRGP